MGSSLGITGGSRTTFLRRAALQFFDQDNHAIQWVVGGVSYPVLESYLNRLLK